MSTLVYEQRLWSLGWFWSFALVLPLLLGASLLEQSPQGPVLSPKDNYRAPVSKTIIENSGAWRRSTSEGTEWRKSETSDRDWRAKSGETIQGPPRSRHVEVLPDYQIDTDYKYSRDGQNDHVNDYIEGAGFSF